jgi:heme exporter protein A
MQLTGDKLTCERGGRIVFRDVSFGIGAGQLLQLTGPNGSGKSSLLRLIAGLNEPSAGTLHLAEGHGELTIGQQSHYIAHQEAVKSALTVAENIGFWSAFLGGDAAEEGLAAFDLARLASYPAGLLSAGQKRRLALSRLVAVRRALWLLDEPTVGLDAASQHNLASVMRAHLEAGGLIIAATHVPLGIEPHSRLDLGGSP